MSYELKNQLIMNEVVEAQIAFLRSTLKLMDAQNYNSLRDISLGTIDRMEKQLLIQEHQ